MAAATGTSLTYSVVGGLPLGLSFAPATRTLSGTPTAVGFYTIVLRATDSSARSLDRTLIVQVRSTAATSAQAPGSDALANWGPTDTSGLHSYVYYDGHGRVVGAVDDRGFLSETVYDGELNTQTTKRFSRP